MKLHCPIVVQVLCLSTCVSAGVDLSVALDGLRMDYMIEFQKCISAFVDIYRSLNDINYQHYLQALTYFPARGDKIKNDFTPLPNDKYLDSWLELVYSGEQTKQVMGPNTTVMVSPEGDTKGKGKLDGPKKPIEQSTHKHYPESIINLKDSELSQLEDLELFTEKKLNADLLRYADENPHLMYYLRGKELKSMPLKTIKWRHFDIIPEDAEISYTPLSDPKLMATVPLQTIATIKFPPQTRGSSGVKQLELSEYPSMTMSDVGKAKDVAKPEFEGEIPAEGGEKPMAGAAEAESQERKDEVKCDSKEIEDPAEQNASVGKGSTEPEAVNAPESLEKSGYLGEINIYFWQSVFHFEETVAPYFEIQFVFYPIKYKSLEAVTEGPLYVVSRISKFVKKDEATCKYEEVIDLVKNFESKKNTPWPRFFKPKDHGHEEFQFFEEEANPSLYGVKTYYLLSKHIQTIEASQSSFEKLLKFKVDMFKLSRQERRMSKAFK